MARRTVVLVALSALAGGCAGANQQPVEAEPVPPFHLRTTAWKIMLEEFPDLAPAQAAQAESASFRKSIDLFYRVVTDHSEPQNATQKVARRRACAKGWSLLSQQVRRQKELQDPLVLARAYLTAECGMARKSLPYLRRLAKRHEQVDFMFYTAHFWTAESLLALNQSQAALPHYRWILGELESPLYPLALLRTAHCHWDAGEVDQAQQHLQYVRDWVGDKTSPPWVRSLSRQVDEDLRDFSSP